MTEEALIATIGHSTPRTALEGSVAAITGYPVLIDATVDRRCIYIYVSAREPRDAT